MFGVGILEGLALSGILYMGTHRRYMKALAYSVFRGRNEIRVSFSTLLRIRQGDNYLLIRNKRRPEQFGPIGGVNKYFDEATDFLNRIMFRPQVVAPEMKRDVRGFLPMRNVPKLIQWYRRREHCESAEACLSRELSEELAEMEVAPVSIPHVLAFVQAHQVVEGPCRVPGVEYRQLRLFDICEFRKNSPEATALVAELWNQGRNHKNLRIVSGDVISRGRLNVQDLIGSHSEYLFRKRAMRPEGPAFVEPKSTANELSN